MNERRHFSERDVLNKVAPNLAALDRPVSDFMTQSPVSLIKQDSIAYALHAMKLGGYRHLPVLNEARRPTGIISVRDILRTRMGASVKFSRTER